MEFYHVLNRGVDKRTIFLDSSDYARFVHNMYVFNDTERADPNVGRVFTQAGVRGKGEGTDPKNHSNSMMDIGCPSFDLARDERGNERLVNIHFFCLMPNHYHLMLSPVADNGISLFMKKLNMGYAKYFNERYERSGALFQGKYKSVRVAGDAHLLYLPYYIHLNPLDLMEKTWRGGKLKNLEKALSHLRNYRWSSHLDYSGTHNFPSITNRSFFLDFYGGTEGYIRAFRKYLYDFDITEIEKVALEKTFGDS